jgi:hypothetical protein
MLLPSTVTLDSSCSQSTDGPGSSSSAFAGDKTLKNWNWLNLLPLGSANVSLCSMRRFTVIEIKICWIHAKPGSGRFHTYSLQIRQRDTNCNVKPEHFVSGPVVKMPVFDFPADEPL